MAETIKKLEIKNGILSQDLASTKAQLTSGESRCEELAIANEEVRAENIRLHDHLNDMEAQMAKQVVLHKSVETLKKQHDEAIQSFTKENAELRTKMEALAGQEKRFESKLREHARVFNLYIDDVYRRLKIMKEYTDAFFAGSTKRGATRVQMVERMNKLALDIVDIRKHITGYKSQDVSACASQ